MTRASSVVAIAFLAGMVHAACSSDPSPVEQQAGDGGIPAEEASASDPDGGAVEADSSVDPDASTGADADADADADASPSTDGSTCGNGIEDPGEQCCTTADRDAFVAAVGAAFIAAFPSSVCRSEDKVGKPEAGAGNTGMLWCYQNGGAGCNPGCLMPTTWTNATATSSGASYALTANVDIATFLMPVFVRLLNAPLGSCNLQPSGPGTLTTTFALVDSGTHVRGTLTAPGTLDLTLGGLDQCGIFADLEGTFDTTATLTASVKARVLEVVKTTFEAQTRACNF